jgi:hypothetical protein
MLKGIKGRTLCALLFAVLHDHVVGDVATNAPPMQAGPDAQAMCEGLASKFQASGLTINNTFSIYYPEGSSPTLEQLTASYPTGTIPKDIRVDPIIDNIGPDLDIKSDAGYGRQQGDRINHGLLGSMPAFCRYGAYVKTSQFTVVLSEIWLPLAPNANIPLAPIVGNQVANSTPYDMNADGTFRIAPLYYLEDKYVKVKAAVGSSNPPAPNDVPEPPAKTSATKAAETNATSIPHVDSVSKITPLIAPAPLSKKPTRRSMAVKSAAHAKRDAQVTRSIPGEAVLGHGQGWNGRLSVMGNGGQRGFVPFPEMKQYLSRYGFAVAGTNLGHWSGTSGVTWVNGSQFDDTLLDWASRANHVTLQLSEQVIDAFYGKQAGCRVAAEGNRIRRYYYGSSIGAARGLSAMQVYPKDFHGLLLGPPAQNFMRMNVGQLEIASVHNKTVAKDGWFTQNSLYGPIKDVVTRQCDMLDGVRDGIISNPSRCKPDLAAEMLCGTNTKYGRSNGTCLTSAQIKNFYKLYEPTIIDGQQVYPAFVPGLEDSAASMNSANAKASGWHQLVVLKQPSLNASFNPFTDIRFADIQRGAEQDPGGVNAVQTDLSAFVNAGGKMMLYHGTYDLVISPQATIQYYSQALLNSGPAAASAFKFYIVPGMRHSRNGQGAWHFGGPTQTAPGNRPLHYDASYDMTLALIAWVEQGSEPQAQISARYVQREAVMPARLTAGANPATDLLLPDTNQNYNWGLRDTRLLCPWPKMAVFNGRNPDGEHGYQAFDCK